MKTELTTEQSQHLLDLGVPREKASIWNKDKTIFKLEDFQNGKILPIEIVTKDHKVFNLNMEGISGMCGSNHTLWFASYERKVQPINWFSALELIDALYQLACWYYGEYLKSEKK